MTICFDGFAKKRYKTEEEIPKGLYQWEQLKDRGIKPNKKQPDAFVYGPWYYRTIIWNRWVADDDTFRGIQSIAPLFGNSKQYHEHAWWWCWPEDDIRYGQLAYFCYHMLPLWKA